MTGMKFAVAIFSGSVGVLSEAIHSALDLVSAGLSYFTVREAVKPADAAHPFGHGKIETLSSLFEAVLLVLAAGLIVKEGIEHLRNPEPLAHGGWAIAVIFVSLVVSYYAYRHNFGAAQATESSALHVNALHFLADVVASMGVLLGLILIQVTGWHVIDPIIAFAVAGYIFWISIGQVKSAIMELSDRQLPDSEVMKIRDIIEAFGSEMIEAHDLRTRKSGNMRHVDFHLVVCGTMTVDQSHSICDEIERQIVAALPRTCVQIHVEPCEADRISCPAGGWHGEKGRCKVFWKGVPNG